MNTCNHRLPGESAVEYRVRRREARKMVGARLKHGIPALRSKDGREYVNGPHRSHGPHEVVAKGSAHLPGYFPPRVMHPGTLVKK